ncbi:hypothetical protein NA78x_005220 [Anatilimnocola sp. NA78]|uniref:hypothetical protein n=1 Tax=Anatilimnocola sp. NA78 TaxID=3415683 RepID=UPI003CE49D94
MSLLLAASTGCSQFSRALYTTANVMGDPDSLYFAKERAGIGTFPVKELTPAQDAPRLLITYNDEDEDGVIYFAHTNQRLHYKQCIARIQEILQKTSGPVNLEIRSGRRDQPWELDFGYELRGIKGFERLQITTTEAISSATP